MNPGIITQARTGSTRLPEKVLRTINNKSLLSYHLERAEWSDLPVIVATTTKPRDSRVAELTTDLGYKTYRGSESDVLQRYYFCAKEFDIDPVIRITSDCPLLDGNLLEKGYQKFISEGVDYLTNNLNPTYPVGQDFQIFTFATLKKTHQQAAASEEREHVIPYMQNNEEFSVESMQLESDFSHHRITVDYPEDFELIKRLIEDFHCESKDYREIIDVMESNPELLRINEQFSKHN